MRLLQVLVGAVDRGLELLQRLLGLGLGAAGREGHRRSLCLLDAVLVGHLGLNVGALLALLVLVQLVVVVLELGLDRLDVLDGLVELDADVLAGHGHLLVLLRDLRAGVLSVVVARRQRARHVGRQRLLHGGLEVLGVALLGGLARGHEVVERLEVTAAQRQPVVHVLELVLWAGAGARVREVENATEMSERERDTKRWDDETWKEEKTWTRYREEFAGARRE